MQISSQSCGVGIGVCGVCGGGCGSPDGPACAGGCGSPDGSSTGAVVDVDDEVDGEA